MLSVRARRVALVTAVAAGLGILAGPASATPTYTGHRLYAVTTDSVGGTLVPFDIGANGQLHERSDQAVALPGSTTGLAVDRKARSVFVSSRDVYNYDDDSSTPGVIEVFAIGADGALTLAQTVPGSTFAIAMAPDGSLFSQQLDGEIDSYPVQADGTLGPERTHFSFSQPANALAIAPDGKTLYMAGQNDLSFQWAIAADASLGFLTPGLFGAPGGHCYPLFIGVAVGSSSVDIQCYFGNGFTFTAGADGALTVNGGPFTGSGVTFGNVEDTRGRAFYGGVWAGGIAQFKRQADGTLAPFPTPSVPSPGQTRVLAVDPDGTMLTAATTASGFQTYAIAGDGSLSAAPVRSTPIAMSPPSYLAYTPQQAPVAAFGTTQAASGATTFDAGASHAFGGRTIARYDWSFGDGTALADAGPAPSHAYPQPGDYTATVTLTDSAGCSVAGTFNGSLSICAGGPGATASATVHVTAPAPATPATPALPEPPLPAAGAAPDPPEAPRPRAATATPDRSGKKVLLSWVKPEDAPGSAPSEYLVAWSTLHSAHGPGDPHMHHLRVKGATHLRMRTTPRSTLHLAVYARRADGSFTRATKITLRLPR
jgi:hypothetical protein